MSSSFDTRTAYVFDKARNLWLMFLLIAAAMWLAPLLWGQRLTFSYTHPVGAVALLVSLCLRFSYYGVEIDAAQRCIRQYISILGIKTGSWRQLPNLQRLLINTDLTESALNGSPLRDRHHTYRITMISKANEPVMVINTTEKELALHTAHALADLLQLEVEQTNQ